MKSLAGSCLRVGVAAVAAVATVVVTTTSSVPAAAPAVADVHPAQVQVAPRIALAASVRSLVTTPPNPEHFAAATAAMSRIDPKGTSAVAQAAPVTLNAASDAIVAGYQFLRYWVTYGVQLADYVLGFVPFGYAIADQVNIFYYNLILPISDSVVYNLVVPVVNDPLNPASYVNGLTAVGQTTVNAVINTAVAEFNYFFGWLIPPLPPRPLAAAAAVSPVAEMTSVATDVAATTEPTKSPEPSKTPETTTTPVVSETPGPAVTPETTVTPEPTVAAAPTATPEPAVTPEPTVTLEPTKTPAPSETPEPTTPSEPTEAPKPPTTTSAGGVQAQGEVRGGTQVTTNPAGSTSTTPTNAKTPTSTTPTSTDPKTTDPKTTDPKTTTSATAANTETNPDVKGTDTDAKKGTAKPAGED